MTVGDRDRDRALVGTEWAREESGEAHAGRRSPDVRRIRFYGSTRTQPNMLSAKWTDTVQMTR